jgi:hypothetical protein
MAFFRIFPMAMALSLGACLLGMIPAAQADPYLRVCRNGVIYYYFDSHGEKKNQASLFSGKNLKISPQAQRRLSVQDLEPLIQEASSSHNVPPSLIKAVIRVESNFNSNATSPKGAQGLMQLMPGTAGDLQVVNPYDQRENIWGGVKYLRLLLEKFGNRLPLALAAYNAGPKRVEQRQGVPAIPETQGFVRDVCTMFLEYSKQEPPGPATIPSPAPENQAKGQMSAPPTPTSGK